MKKTDYPGGVKLTLKTARAVAVQEFGTAKEEVEAYVRYK